MLAIIAIGLSPLSAVGQTGSIRHPETQIGVLDGSPAEVFGVISAVGVAGDGGVFVLDPTAYELRWFDADGRYRATAGRKGRGPGELLQPSAMAVTRDGRVHVLDNPNMRISTFRRKGAVLEHEKDVRLPFVVSDMCMIGGRRFVLAIGQPQLIYELDETGAVVRSFGSPEQPDAKRRRGFAASGARLLADVLNQGHMLCDARTNRVFLVHSALFLVRAFSVDGRSLWRTDLADVAPQEIMPVRAGTGIGFGPNRKTGRRSSADGLALSADGTIVVTIVQMVIQQGDRLTTYEERRLRPSDGREVGRATARGLIVAIQGGKRYAYSSDPFPRVLIY